MAYWGQVTVRDAGPNRTILVSGEPVLIVTPEDAASQNSTAGALAQAWAARLKDALDLPPLKVSDNFVKLPTGGSAKVRITGSEADRATIDVSAPSIARTSRSGSDLKITAVGVGHATVSVTAGRAMENIDVQVLPYAANFPQTINVTVTGAPATKQMVCGAVAGALRTRLEAVSSAHWSFGHVEASQLETGATRSYSVQAWAASSEAYPSSGEVTVVVKNAALPLQTDGDLWYSNDPETVRQPAPLFSASLKNGRSARLLYHHLNGSMQDMFIRVEAINESDKPARIELIPGDSKPDRDPVKAGAAAADQFFQNWMFGSGEVITVPAGSALPISLHRLSPGETASGLCSIRLVDGPPDVLIRTDAFPPFPLDEKWRGALFSSTPWREVGVHSINQFDRSPCEASPHIYPNPYAEDRMDYEVGGRFGFMRIGSKPIARQDSDGVLDGNFGVIYNIRASLKNPTNEAADVELVFQASAGYAGGIFVINGSYLKTSVLAPKGVVRIAKYHLMPGGTEQLDITTLPLSGSSYPATLLIRPVSAADTAAGKQ